MTTNINTGSVRLSYAHIFKPHAMDQGVEPKYSVSLLIPKSDTKTLKAIKAAVEVAVEKGKDDKWSGKIPANLKRPLRDGDAERPDDEVYAGHYFLNASSKSKPQIVKPVGKKPDGKTKFEDIVDETEAYSGCYAKVNLNFYPYSVSGSKGIAAGLNAIVKVQDGEPLGGGRISVDDAFGDEDFDIDFDDEEDFM